ncbi:MAG: putative flavin-containing monoamine oxidase AofH [Rhodothalassiaceae bacterium]|nr:MAG: putative flavin-containing monoamine oxidase AofH [Rhodothalassiaceae bacterium]
MTQKAIRDVAVIGAGLSGLHAASLLAARGLKVALIEARGRVGGRAELHRFANGDAVDIGGQWVGPGQERMYRLIADLGLRTWPLYHEGDRILMLGRRRRRYRGLIPPASPLALLELEVALRRFERMAATVDPARPWAHPRAAAWDRMTLDAWMRRNLRTTAARRLFAIGIGAVFAAAPEELSLLHALFYARAAGGFRGLLEVEGGAQQDRVRGGVGGLAEAYAARCREQGVEIALARPVVAVAREGAGVRVVTTRETWRARRAVLALPPNQLRRIRFDPPAPARRDRLWQRMPAGRAIKCVAQYRTPFWRAERLSGEAVGGPGPVHVTFDNTEEGGAAGLLMGFIAGPEADRWAAAAPEARRAAVLESFAAFFGPEARNAIDYADRDWGAEEWTRGCYAALMTPGAWTALGAELRAPLGPLHFAGTETATAWYGYFEGALEAAERAAGEVAAALDG